MEGEMTIYHDDGNISIQEVKNGESVRFIDKYFHENNINVEKCIIF